MALRIKKIALFITLPLVLWLFYNQAANWHFHLLENGDVVEHAHPYQNSGKSDSPFQDHHHTEFEFSVLSLISQITWGLWWLTLLVLGVFASVSQTNFYTVQHGFLGIIPTINPLRGPPATI